LPAASVRSISGNPGRGCAEAEGMSDETKHFSGADTFRYTCFFCGRKTVSGYPVREVERERER